MIKYILATAIIFITIIGCNLLSKNESKTVRQDTKNISKGELNLDTATLAGGCFWCMEAIFQDLKGIEKVTSGFSGGKTKNPSYEEVCSGTTGYAEAIEITFDPSVISYEQLLECFFHAHDPTTLNKQGNDMGTQYRSAIFYHNEQQKKTAEDVKDKIAKSGLWNDPIVTEISSFNGFYSAEDYHQNYFKNNPEKGYCSFVIAPKVRKFYKEYGYLLKEGVEK